MISRCFPHIINICCQHVIKEFTDTDLVDAAKAFTAATPSSHPSAQTFAEACARDPIALGREVVQALRASGQRRDQFKETIKDGNTRRHFFVDGQHDAISLPVLELLRDVRTRWDSVYYMMRRLRELRPVCHLYTLRFLYLTHTFQAIDYHLASPLNKDLANFRLSEKEWGVLQDFEAVMEVRCSTTFSLFLFLTFFTDPTSRTTIHV